jgi:phosphoribosylglycinamide formyltransferase-1
MTAAAGTDAATGPSVVVLISGRGSNLRSIVESNPPCRIAAVISNRPDAAGLAFARMHGIATEVVDHSAFAAAQDPRAAFDAALMQAIDRHQPALVVLAGFMRILTPGFVAHYAGRLLNVHPSLLPAFTGLHTHRRAIEAGCKFAGATVHQVTAELDHGPILAQAVVPVLPGDDEATLAARVLTQEHLIYPQAITEMLARL